ncbi:MAG: HD domain-containing protein [Thaumarchaeota archaeon]|nr:HD domain-containing protein [Nitrososphaerota archaeon]
MLKPVAEIRDPVHGYIKITEVERELIDSPFVQRLRRIHQLAGAYLVYPGAVHTRFDHVVGAMYVAGLIAESLANRIGIEKEEIQAIRLAALLHDVGHGPFSHIYEEVLAEKTNTTHEDISQRMILETPLKDILEKNGYSSNKMSEFCVGKQASKPRFMNEIIAGGLSADIMDYLLRDSYFTGVEYGKVDIHRIIDSLDVINKHLALDQAAVYAFEALLIARYEMFKAVYFHRTVRAAELMLVHAMALADRELELTDLSVFGKYLELTDETVLQRLTSLDAKSSDLQEARRLAKGFRDRRLVKCVFERVIQRRDRIVEQIFDKASVRTRVVLDLAEKAKVDPMYIYLDVPTTPSVPYTSSRESLRAVILFSDFGRKRRHESTPIDKLPLAGSIIGFMDAVRVYTTSEYRGRVSRATKALLNNEEYMSGISN